MTTEATNGTVPQKEPTILARAHEAWLKAGAKEPDAKTATAVKKALADADEAYAAAEKHVEEAREKRHKAAEAAIKAFGAKTSLRLADGSVVQPFCRGESLFYRRATQNVK